MARRDLLDEPPAYDSLFDTTAQLPNYTSITQPGQTRDNSTYRQPCTSRLQAASEPRRGSATSSTSGSSEALCSCCSAFDASSSSQHTKDSATTTANKTLGKKKKNNNKSTSSSSSSSSSSKTKSTSEGFFAKWRADLAEDRARRATRVVYISVAEADRIMGIDQMRARQEWEDQPWNRWYR